MPRLPDWVPQVPRPFNPAWRDAWRAMTPNDRRWSFVADLAICAAFFVFCALVF